MTAWFAAPHLEMLQWLRADGCAWDAEFVLSRAATAGKLAIVQWAHAQGDPIDNLCEGAAFGGRIELLRWLRRQGCPWGKTLQRAIQGGHLELVEWAVAEGCPCEVYGIWPGCGGIAMYEWLERAGYDWSMIGVSNLAAFGQVTAAELEWVVSRGARLHPLQVFEVGSLPLDALAWLVERGAVPTCGTFARAAVAGRLDMLEWLHARGCPFDADACIVAVLVEGNRWRVHRGTQSAAPDQFCFRKRRQRREVVAWLEAHLARQFNQ
jgi:hypothetical protein